MRVTTIPQLEHLPNRSVAANRAVDQQVLAVGPNTALYVPLGTVGVWAVSISPTVHICCPMLPATSALKRVVIPGQVD